MLRRASFRKSQEIGLITSCGNSVHADLLAGHRPVNLGSENRPFFLAGGSIYWQVHDKLLAGAGGNAGQNRVLLPDCNFGNLGRGKNGQK